MVEKKTTKKTTFSHDDRRMLSEIRHLTSTERNEPIVHEINRMMTAKSDILLRELKELGTIDEKLEKKLDKKLDEKTTILRNTTDQINKKADTLLANTKTVKRTTRRISEEARAARMEEQKIRKVSLDFTFATISLGISVGLLFVHQCFLWVFVASTIAYVLAIISHFLNNTCLKAIVMWLQIIFIGGALFTLYILLITNNITIK